MQRKVLELIKQDNRVSPQKKRPLDEEDDDEGIEFQLPDAKTPRFQSPFGKRL